MPWPELCGVVGPRVQTAGGPSPPRAARKCLVPHGRLPWDLLCCWSRRWPDQKQLLGERCIEIWLRDFVIMTATRLGSLPCCPRGRALGGLQGAPTLAGHPTVLPCLRAAPWGGTGHISLQQQARYPGPAAPSCGSSVCHGSCCDLLAGAKRCTGSPRR